MTQLTDEDIDSIEKRCSLATKGPWNVDHVWPYAVMSPGGDIATARHDGEYTWVEMADDDMYFIAASRTDIPALLTAYRALAAERDALKAAMQPWPCPECDSLYHVTERTPKRGQLACMCTECEHAWIMVVAP